MFKLLKLSILLMLVNTTFQLINFIKAFIKCVINERKDKLLFPGKSGFPFSFFFSINNINKFRCLNSFWCYQIYFKTFNHFQANFFFSYYYDEYFSFFLFISILFWMFYKIQTKFNLTTSSFISILTFVFLGIY